MCFALFGAFVKYSEISITFSNLQLSNKFQLLKTIKCSEYCICPRGWILED